MGPETARVDSYTRNDYRVWRRGPAMGDSGSCWINRGVLDASALRDERSRTSWFILNNAMSKSILHHPLVGTWITEDEDSNVAFVISVAENTFHVSGFSRSSAVPFEISDVVWDGEALSFTARFPPTNTITRNLFRARSNSVADLELTTYEVWIKKKVRPGDLPEAWRTPS